MVVHIHTVKGKGYENAENNKEAFQWVMTFDLGTKKTHFSGAYVKSYGDITGEFLVEKAKADPSIVDITAATPSIVGLDGFRGVLDDQYIDVGIVEEHAVALASGIAK